MSGHNKWSKIKVKKGASDAKRSALFSKLTQQITQESKKCGGDPQSPGLRSVIDDAKSKNMPTDNIQRAVARGVGDPKEVLNEVLYEGFAPGGTGLLIQVSTDNKNRSVAAVRHTLKTHGGSLDGSSLWCFQKGEDGYIPTTTVPLDKEGEEKLSTLISALEEIEEVEKIFHNGVST